MPGAAPCDCWQAPQREKQPLFPGKHMDAGATVSGWVLAISTSRFPAA